MFQTNVIEEIKIQFFCAVTGLWNRDVTPKTKTHIYHAIVKSTITYAAETWCLKAKTLAKLNSTEMDFWRRSA